MNNSVASAVAAFILNALVGTTVVVFIFRNRRNLQDRLMRHHKVNASDFDLYTQCGLCILCIGSTFMSDQAPELSIFEKIIAAVLGLASITLANVLWTYTVLRTAGRGFWRRLPHNASLQDNLKTIGFATGALFLNYGFVFKDFGIQQASNNLVSHNIFTALYFTVMTWTTVGYGDFIPYDGWTRFFAALAALNGYVILALLISSLSQLFLGEDKG